jgi:glycopeptide antibiotics resistance protein
LAQSEYRKFNLPYRRGPLTILLFLKDIVCFMSFGSGTSEMFAVSHLRFKWIWLSFGVLLICTITVLSLINLAPISGVLLQDKVMHMLAYGFLMGWFAQIYRHLMARLVLVVALVVMGVAVEYLQGMLAHRQFDTMDMVANTFGVLLAWLLSYTWLGRVFVVFERLIPR